ncbi:TetR/AcrR family transcriptional regulator [Phenylobacterium sp.]|jgi:AcrR family transcriptional regulator|uniref:TetR/AcrR family transcriptional regulator n=1 Tax=Phenylobacterium sp. TaxID=1871053 RepID=UPI0025DA0D79|nr:TetR/AcrR family transcriptional regulator [Phenylobacterium sp.]MCA3722102.1 TetR/AcrR family transcriptional regulator [Phenylobacterium sp.]
MIPVEGRSTRKPRGRGNERREEILNAALRLFSQSGVTAVSTRDIAGAVGISQPVLYTHFRNRDDLLAEVTERAFSELEQRVSPFSIDAMTGRAAFLRFCRIYVDFGLEQPDAYRMAFMLEKRKSRLEALDPRILAAGLKTFQRFEERLARLVSRGLTRPGDARLLAQTLWAGLHGLVSLLLARQDFPWADRETLITRHLDMLADGLFQPEDVTPRR